MTPDSLKSSQAPSVAPQAPRATTSRDGFLAKIAGSSRSLATLALAAMVAVTPGEASAALPDCDPGKCACPDDAKKPPARRASAAKPEVPTPVCRDVVGAENHVLKQPYGYQSDAVQLSAASTIVEGDTVFRAVDCFDVYKNGTEKDINDEQRLRELVEKQIEVSINDVKVRITEVKMHAGQVLIYLNYFKKPGKYNVVIRSLTDSKSRNEFNLEVTADAAKKVADRKEDKKDEGKKDEDKDKKSGKKSRYLDEDSDKAPVEAETVGDLEFGNHFTVGFTGQSDLDEPSRGPGLHGGMFSKISQRTAIGGDLQVDFMQDRGARFNGEDVAGAKSYRFFPGAAVTRTLAGTQFKGGHVGLKAGPIVEKGTEFKVKDGRIIGGDATIDVGVEGSAGFTISSLTQGYGARFQFVVRAEYPAQRRLGDSETGTRISGGFTIDLIIHTAGDRARKVLKENPYTNNKSEE